MLCNLFHKLVCFSLREFSQSFCLYSDLNVKVKSNISVLGFYRKIKKKLLGGKSSFLYIVILLNAVGYPWSCRFSSLSIFKEESCVYLQIAITSVLIHKCGTVCFFIWLSLYSMVCSVIKKSVGSHILHFSWHIVQAFKKKTKASLYQLYEIGLKMETECN